MKHGREIFTSLESFYEASLTTRYCIELDKSIYSIALTWCILDESEMLTIEAVRWNKETDLKSNDSLPSKTHETPDAWHAPTSAFGISAQSRSLSSSDLGQPVRVSESSFAYRVHHEIWSVNYAREHSNIQPYQLCIR